MISNTPPAPYYAVIFTNIRTPGDQGYAEMAQKMDDLARQQPGYLGHESARDKLGITVSYWESREAITAWKNENQHRLAQKAGREKWYQHFKIRICKVESDYAF
ncbi:antibiotic biosynthesis monooxygenase family protein [Cyclobacterium plantarum]|uniref:Antibiotic biosynthesis monooxygenase n=1 Tax=Cyclobacterium plantarum TaxID=2716263 RepID=A0ABX0HE06_9BACT|nr:antibiotic biosynthesis monooxygenase [Cyclobacterium plantarum]NHE59979.1 antibiotic biosynthesis monooxygenase [Cyclobacterium plantarum]